ncbi:hypothetical protein OSB04_021120 [Centaurea solstitialis]|uniref:Phorbol-ester/DAG-type domain-containing protein n=1 Tax=Centaurea solstitialis TaxID=347529 RepID=A0AA38TC09_9ASTR|nr:hypothetical protein OSB04_021120 [Centaurea solstitialis]
MPFYMCDNESCNFALHEWCTRLPDQVQNHPGHPQHTLLLLPKLPHKPLGVFECDACGLQCNGFAYSCLECGKYNTDVTCAFIPEKIRHEAHPNHLIWRTYEPCYGRTCRSCLNFLQSNNFSFSCRDCDFVVHARCAFFLPQTIRQRFEKHLLKLSYLPSENHRGLYFCEICEEQFDPKHWFYHCYECRQSIHGGCAPLILECEKPLPYIKFHTMYPFVNIKFGGMHNIEEDHPHPLSFVQGNHKDGRHCHKCKETFSGSLILKLFYEISSPVTEAAFFLRVDQSEHDVTNYMGLTSVFETTCPVQVSLLLPPEESKSTTRNIAIIWTLYAAELISLVVFFWDFLKKYVKYRDMARTFGIEFYKRLLDHKRRWERRVR